MLEVAKCQRCQKELTVEMELEYSGWLGDSFCGHKCAVDYYFEYMESSPTDCKDLSKEDLKQRGLKVVRGKIYKI